MKNSSKFNLFVSWVLCTQISVQLPIFLLITSKESWGANAPNGSKIIKRSFLFDYFREHPEDCCDNIPFSPKKPSKSNSLSGVDTYSGLDTDSPEYQDRSQFFAGEPPKSFDKLAKYGHVYNKKWKKINEQKKLSESDSDSKIVTNTGNSKKDKKINIAVIDIGVDPHHPEIQSRLKYNEGKSGEFAGFGLDFMHVDPVPYGGSQLLDPWPYALSGDGMNEKYQLTGKISETPLRDFAKLNDEILEILKTEIKNNQTLSSSLFSKIDSKNTNLIGLMRLANTRAMSPKVINVAASSDEEQKKIQQEKEELIKKFSEHAWIMDSKTGLPDFWSEVPVPSDQAYAEFRKILVEKVFQSEKFKEAATKMSNLAEYFKVHHFSPGSENAVIMSYALDKLSEQLTIAKLGTGVSDPSYRLFLELRKMKVRDPQLQWDSLVSTELSLYQNVLQNLQLHPDIKQSTAEINNLRDLLSSAESTEKFLLQLRSWDEDLVNNAADSLNVESNESLVAKWLWRKKNGVSREIREFYARKLSPYLHPESSNQSHATHISMTPMGYEEIKDKYNVFSVRIPLGRVKVSNPDIKNHFVSKNTQALNEWMSDPLVATAILKSLKENDVQLSTVNYDGPLEPNKINNLILELLPAFQTFMQIDIEQNGVVGQSLHWNLKSAIEKIAESKIPVANLSFGGASFQPDRRYNLGTSKDRLNSVIPFVFQEFQKSIIADAITTTGKNTLFMIAAGNENNYSDADSLSNFPADLRSKWLSRAREENPTLFQNKKLAQDHLSNVITVVSSNEHGRRSNFTSINMQTGRQVLIRGEGIRSGTSSYSLAGVNQVLQERASWLFKVLSHLGNPDTYSDQRLLEVLESLGINPSILQKVTKNVPLYIRSLTRRLLLKFNDRTQLMDGTSMATPNAVAVVMKIINEILIKNNIDTVEEAISRGLITPEIISQELEKIGSVVKIGDVLPVLSFQEEVKIQKDSKKTQKMRSILLDIEKKSISCLKNYLGSGGNYGAVLSGR